jgi:nucleoside-diphosphate-sugar epimerase
MKVLITGSSGSLGSTIAASLVARKIPVIGIDIKESPENGTDGFLTFYKCSITDFDGLKDVFSKEEPSHVIHLACTFNKVRNRLKEQEIDIGGSKNVIEISNKTKSVRQLIYSSSAAAYGGNRDNPGWIKESHPLRPGKYRYGINKRLIEALYTETPVRDDLHIVLARICTVIGPSYNKPASVVSILLKLPWLPEFVRENKVQFLHTEDFVSLINLMISDDQIKGVFNIAPDSYSEVKDLIPGKKFIKIPVSAMIGALSLLWHLKILNLEPAAINASIYPILLDPGKIISRYNYRFKFSAAEAFEDVKMHNMIPSGAKF